MHMLDDNGIIAIAEENQKLDDRATSLKSEQSGSSGLALSKQDAHKANTKHKRNSHSCRMRV
jgi:hypothetical protein